MIIETESSTYEVDLDNSRLRRWPRSERNIPGELVAATLRKDEEWIPIIRLLEPPAVGRPAVFLLAIRDDGVETVRTTTKVVSIAR